jgi:hypothetical protein
VTLPNEDYECKLVSGSNVDTNAPANAPLVTAEKVGSSHVYRRPTKLVHFFAVEDQEAR